MKSRLLSVLLFASLVLSLRAEPGDAERNLFEKGRKALEDTLYVPAESFYLNLLTQFPQSELKPDAQIGLAQALYFQKRYKESVKLLEPAMKAAPKRLLPEIRFWLAENYARLERPEEAARLLELFLAETPMDSRADEARYGLAWLYSRQNRFDEAAVLLKTVQKNERPDLAAKAAFGLAMLPFYQKNFDEAEKNLAAMVRKYPKAPASLEARFQLAEIALDKGNDTVALQRYQDVIEGEGPAGVEFVDEALLRVGEINERQKKYSDAMMAYERAYKKTKFEAVKVRALEQFVTAAEKNDRVDVAVDKLKAWADDPKNPMSDDLYLACIKLWRKTGKSERASQELDEFFDKFPQSELVAEACLEKGAILEQGNALEQAMVVYQKVPNATKVPELQAEAYFRMANILRTQGNVDEAGKMYQRASALKGAEDSAVQALWEAGQTQLKAQNWAAAISSFDKLIKKYPDDPRSKDAELQMAFVQFQKGQFDASAEAYEAFAGKYGAADPLAAKAAFGRVQSLSRKRDWGAVLKAASEFLKAFPQSEYVPQVKLQRAYALQESDRNQEAIEAYESTVKEHPNTEAGAMAQMRVAEYYYSQRNYAKAQEQFSLIGRNFPNSSVASDAAYFAAVSAYKFKQDLNDAKKLAARFLELFPNSPHGFAARMLQGDILTEQQDYAGALVVFENLIESTDIAKKPDLNQVYLSAMGRKGELLRILEKYDDAIAAFQAILDMPNVDVDTAYNTEVQIARCFEKKGDSNKALEHYLNVIYGGKAGPQATESFWFAKAGLNAATLKEEQKDFSGAAKILQRMVKSNAACKTIAAERLKQIRELHPELP